MSFSRNDLFGQTIFATGSDRQETVLASLTSSELVSSTEELVTHLLQIVQLRSTRLPAIKSVRTDSYLQVDGVLHKGESQLNTTGESQLNATGESQLNASGESHLNATGESQLNAMGEPQHNTTDSFTTPSIVSNDGLTYGITYPSALLDFTAVSGCSIPPAIGQ